MIDVDHLGAAASAADPNILTVGGGPGGPKIHSKIDKKSLKNRVEF